MSMKKLLSLGLALIVSVGMLVGCRSGQEPTSNETSQEENKATEEAKYEDGIYFAQEDGFSEKSGWKYMVTLKVEDGKIVEAEWNGANKEAGRDKITLSEAGEYGMVENGGAQARWHEQAAKAEAYLIEKQDPTAIEYTDEEGHTDAISGVSIHVSEFFNLAEKALEEAK